MAPSCAHRATRPSRHSAGGGRLAFAPRTLLVRLWGDRWIYLFLLPTVVLYGLYTLWPIVASYYYSLLDWDGIGRAQTFVGLANYREVLRDPFFWRAFRITFLFMLITVPIRVTLSLAAAIVLNHPRLPFRTLFRTALFLPVVTTTAIIGVVMGFVFDPAGGPVNVVLLRLQLIDRPINFLGTSGTALYTVMGVHVWKWFGVTLIYWLAALQTVSEDLFEAARIDGATAWQIFRHITMPLLLPFAAIILLLTALETMNVFDLVLTMTGGGPFFSTEVIEVYLYRTAFASATPRLGYASAIGVAFGLATLLLALIQAAGLHYVRREERAK